MSAPKITFDLKKIRLSIDLVLPVRKMKKPHKTIVRYHTIVASIKEVGLIEPLMVFPQRDQPGHYLIMDGHLRYYALKELGISTQETASCPCTSQMWRDDRVSDEVQLSLCHFRKFS